MNLTAAAFWARYQQELRAVTDWTGYGSKLWTPEGIGAATRAMARLGLKTEVGYETCVNALTTDAVGFEWRHCYDWTLRVAFEHELKDGDWRRELCKLTHIVADLRVLVAFANAHGRHSARERLQRHVDVLGMGRLMAGGREWLLALGPSSAVDGEPYRAFTIDAADGVVDVGEADPLIPAAFIRPT